MLLMRNFKKISFMAAGLGMVAIPAFAQEDAITVVLPEQVSNLDPCNATNSHVGRVVSQNITETLTRLNPEDGVPYALLATEWEQEDDLTWRFTLREDVTFQDGKQFDAAAAAYAIERLMNQEITCASRSKLSNLVMIPEVVGDYVLEVRTEIPMPILPTLMSLVMIVSPDTPMDENTNEPIGTGPYQLTDYTPEQVVLERFDDYWGKAPEIAQATYVWRSESALRAAMVQTGEADLAPVIAVQDATNPETDSAYLNAETTRFRIDLGVPPLDDVRVRKALNLAVDWEGLATLFGPGVLRASQMVIPGVLGHNPDIEPWSYDPEEARRLLEEARADGVPVDTELNVIARSGNYPNSQEATEAMTAMWADVGIQTRITTVDAAGWTEYLNKPFPEGRGASLLMQMHDNVTGDAVFTVPLSYRSDGQYSTVTDAELDALIAEAGAASGEERAALYQEVFRRVHDEIVAEVVMFHMVGYTRVGPRIDWEPTITTNSQIPLADISLNN